MKIAEIYKLENNNTNKCFLIKDGIFWWAYEKSAMLFCRHIKDYRITEKYFKNIKASLAYLGFPSSILDNNLTKCKKKGFEIKRNTELIEIIGFDGIEGFEDWKDQFNEKEIEFNVKKENDKTEIENIVFDKIRRFAVIESSPMDCQRFIIELQNIVNGAI